MQRQLALATLLHWLGPWTASERVPPGIERERWTIDGLETYLYRPPRPAIGTYVIAPGLHFLGPDDPRLDRFCRVLARAGFVVVAPFLPAFTKLTVAPSAADDQERVTRATLARFPEHRPTLFSISFGSWPALETAARLGDAVDGVIAFGGYASFEAAVRFCIDGVMRTPAGDVQLARDPLNQPALFLNVLPHIDADGDTSALEAAWREMARRTWGRMELKQPGRLEPFARELAPSVPEPQRELFLIGCGVVPGAAELVESALRRAGDAFRFASPEPAIARLTCPVVVCHGQGDDVIPWSEALVLASLLERRVATRLLVTGLYGHTGAEKPTPTLLAKEALTMLALARTLASGSRLSPC